MLLGSSWIESLLTAAQLRVLQTSLLLEMGSTQEVYATNLRQSCGYPLHSPEPRSELGVLHIDEGLQIGDVGSVNSEGEFETFFNIRFPLPIKYQKCDVPSYKPVESVQSFSKHRALGEDHLFMTGVQRVVSGSRYACYVGIDASIDLT